MPPKPRKSKKNKKPVADAETVEQEIKRYVCNEGHSVCIHITKLVLDNYRDINRDGIERLKTGLKSMYLSGLNLIVKQMGDGSGRYLVIDGSHRVVAWLELIKENEKPKDTALECLVYSPSTPPYIVNLVASAANHASTVTVAETYIDRMRWCRYVCCFFCNSCCRV